MDKQKITELGLEESRSCVGAKAIPTIFLPPSLPLFLCLVRERNSHGRIKTSLESTKYEATDMLPA